MRLLWIYTLTLAFILAFVFRKIFFLIYSIHYYCVYYIEDVNGEESKKKGAGHKGVVNPTEVQGGEKHYHPDVGRDGSVTKGPSEQKLPSGDRSSLHKGGRDHSASSSGSSSSSKHGDKSSRRDRKHKDRKNRKDKSDKSKKHHDGKKKHHAGKNPTH